MNVTNGMTIGERLSELGAKPKGYIFTKEETDFLKKHNHKSNYEVRYIFWKGISKQGKNLGIVYDTMSNSPRKSGVENFYEEVSERRQITDVEYNEMIENFGTCNRRFQVYFFKYIEDLIESEALYFVSVPEKYIKEAKKRNYTNEKQ